MKYPSLVSEKFFLQLKPENLYPTGRENNQSQTKTNGMDCDQPKDPLHNTAVV
jgi:hypothetical protein